MEFFNSVFYCVIVWFVSMMCCAWFELALLLLFLLTFMYSLHLVGNILLVCPMYSLGESGNFLWYMTLRKYLLCRFYLYQFPICIVGHERCVIFVFLNNSRIQA